MGLASMPFSTAGLTILWIRCPGCGQRTEKLDTVLVRKSNVSVQRLRLADRFRYAGEPAPDQTDGVELRAHRCRADGASNRAVTPAAGLPTLTASRSAIADWPIATVDAIMEQAFVGVLQRPRKTSGRRTRGLLFRIGRVAVFGFGFLG
jgi:hypothetical protein